MREKYDDIKAKYEQVMMEVWKKQFSKVLCHDLYWENKTYKLKRSINQNKLCQSLQVAGLKGMNLSKVTSGSSLDKVSFFFLNSQTSTVWVWLLHTLKKN